LLAAVVFYFSRRIHRRLSVTVHRASFVNDPTEYYFVNVTNLSLNRELEITHVWFEMDPVLHFSNSLRPLPKRLKSGEQWSTWIPVTAIVSAAPLESIYRLARVQLSSGQVFKSRRNRKISSFGAVPGVLQGAPDNTTPAVSKPSLPARAVDVQTRATRL